MLVFSSIAMGVVILLAIILLLSFFWACKSFEAMLAIIVFLFCLDAIAVGLPILHMGKNIQVFDPISITLFFAGLTRLVFGQKSIGVPQWLLISLLVLMSVPLSLGFKQYGMAAAPDFRFFFHFMALALYASSFNFEQVNFTRLATYLLWGGMILILLAFCRWAAGAAGLAIAESWRVVGAGREFRVLNAAQSYFIAQAGLLLLIIGASDWGNMAPVKQKAVKAGIVVRELASFWRRWAIVLSGICLAIAFGLMHRSVWVSMAAGMGLLALFDSRQRAGLAQIILISALIGFTVLVPMGLLGFLDSFIESLEASFTEVTAHHSSFADRYLGWQALLSEWWTDGNILTYALGQPFGSGYYRKIAEFGASYSAEYTPHNFYVQMLLRTGMVGLGLFLSLVAATGMGLYHALSKIKRSGNPEFGVRLFLLVSLVMQLVFFLAYGARLEQGLLFGLAMAAATSRVQVQDRGKFSSEELASCRP
ncbi:MAG: hypothetical protein BGO99_07275 [Nitrosospira sp. 56-18]|jgi:hypothetical protein|nr:MAG: hypothetical protein BGO99_07275 [Nitrosospira sp. 56-18]